MLCDVNTLEGSYYYKTIYRRAIATKLILNCYILYVQTATVGQTERLLDHTVASVDAQAAGGWGVEGFAQMQVSFAKVVVK